MPRILSYVRHENELLPGFRQRLSLTRSTEEVNTVFSRAVMEFLERASKGRLRPRFDQVEIAPDQARGYRLVRGLGQDPVLLELSRDSDLAAILERFAKNAAGRHRHVQKHLARTERKIFHGLDLAPH